VACSSLVFRSRSLAVGEVVARLRVEPSVSSDRLWAVVVVAESE
jgi:hypothetical protein